MNDIVIYFNPNCSKCRNALETLRDNDVAPEIVKYLDDPPTRETLAQILDVLVDPPADLVRKDSRFEELNLSADDYTTVDPIIELLLRHPELMQRPVIIQGGRATIARTPEKLDAILNG